MSSAAEAFFAILFQSGAPRIIVKDDAPDFTIWDYNRAFATLLLDVQHQCSGQQLLSVVAAGALGASNGVELSAMLTRCADMEDSWFTDVFNYEQGLGDELPDTARSWQAEIQAVRTPTANFFMITLHDRTAAVLAEARLRQQEKALLASRQQLESLDSQWKQTAAALKESDVKVLELTREFEARVKRKIQRIESSEHSLRTLVMSAHYPLMILRGSDWVIEIANQPLVNLWEKTIEGVQGKKLMDILPEIENQPFPSFLKQVFDTGVGYGQEEQLFYYNSPSGPATKYVSFYYDPMFDEQGAVSGIIVAAEDITAKVQQRKMLEGSLLNEQALVEEMSALNDELAATVEELSATNEELLASQQSLFDKHNDLQVSESRFRLLIKQAPVGICVIRAEDLMVLEVNDGYLTLVGKERQELENRTIWEAVAEAAENYAPIMQGVIDTGIPFLASEHELTLVRYGRPEVLFIDFVYEPVIVPEGGVTAIMVVAIDVSEKVRARQAIEEAEQRTRLAVESAEIGTFEYNYLSDQIVTSERFDQIFHVSRPRSRRSLLPIFHPEDIHLSAEAHARAAVDGKMFYEARLVHPDGSLRWIRVHATVFYQASGDPGKLLGTILDVTDFKKLQRQKDDFISIASHELKTPITTLKAALQFLLRIKDRPESPAFATLLLQANRSMERVTSLIEDLLNVSTMGNDGIGLNKRYFALRQLMDNCCAQVREDERYALIVSGDVELEVFADESRIEQVLVNFVNNSMKYAPQSSEIYLSMERLPDRVKVSVRDNGPGIPLEKQKKIFDRYFRAEDSGQHVSGLGLGLYISADIVHRHEGEIGVDSEPGHGATFWFTLPLHEVKKG